MNKEFIKLNRIMSLLALVGSLIVYTLTVAPTVSYWDCGEFISAAFSLGIPHPPGAPLYLILSRVAAMLAIDLQHVAFMVNYLSVLLSAFTIFFMYLSIMRLFNEWKGFPESSYEFWMRSLSSLVGSFAFAFSHSFWFNAVETELYAAHMFLTALMVWITLLWAEHHEEEGSDRYILLFAYVVGLSTGIHIVTLLNIPFITIFYYIKKSKNRSFTKLAIAALIGLGLSFVVYPGVSKYFPSMVLAMGDIMWGAIIIVLFIGISVYLFATQQKRIVTLLFSSLTLVLIGYSSYSMIYIRSGLNPIIDENNPETLESFIKYINREQYGSMDILPRRWSVKGRHNKINWVGDGTGVLNRFPNNEVKKIKSVEELGPNSDKLAHFSAQMQYTWNYQIVHMLFRGMGWNFLGVPDGEPQDAPSDLSKFFMIPLLLFMFGAVYQFSRNIQTAGLMTAWLFAAVLVYPNGGFLSIAIILSGLYGLYLTFKDSFKDDLSLHGWALMAIWVMSGIALQIYLNQNEPQPRERDYTSVAVFYIMAIWISYAVYVLIDLVKEKLNNQTISYGIAALTILIVPVNMLAKNFNGHDRSGNTVAWDYSYNILMSCDKDAILFTNGDNDTFPIWYLQIVEGIRPDVTSVNLSLLNTPWYIKEQKHGQLGTAAPISASDVQIEKAYKSPRLWKERRLNIKVPKGQMQSDMNDYQLFKKKILKPIEKDSSITFKLPPQATIQTGQGPKGFLRVQDMVALNMIIENNWKRPINWAVTVGSSNLMGGLRDYMRMDGLVYKLTTQKDWQIDPIKLEELLTKVYRYRNLTDKNLFLNSNIQGLLQNIRSAFLQLAQYYAQQGNTAKQKELILKMNEFIDPEVIPITNRSVRLLVDLMTRFEDMSKITLEDLATDYSESDLEFIWQNAHYVMKNSDLRNIAMEAQMSKLDILNQKRMQLAAYLINFNKADTTVKNTYKRRFLKEYDSNKAFVKQLERL